MALLIFFAATTGAAVIPTDFFSSSLIVAHPLIGENRRVRRVLLRIITTDQEPVSGSFAEQDDVARGSFCKTGDIEI